MDSEKRGQIIQEISILKGLSSHDHIVTFVTAATVDASTRVASKCDEFLVLMEYCPKNLADIIRTRTKPFPPATVAKIFCQVSQSKRQRVSIKDVTQFPPPPCVMVIWFGILPSNADPFVNAPFVSFSVHSFQMPFFCKLWKDHKVAVNLEMAYNNNYSGMPKSDRPNYDVLRRNPNVLIVPFSSWVCMNSVWKS